MVRILLLNLPKFFEPDFDRPIGDHLDIFKPDDLAVIARAQFAVTRHDVYDLARFEADSLGDCAAPAGVVGFGEHAGVGSRRAGAEQEWIGKLDSVNCD